MKKVLAIIDNEKEYATRLMDYINRRTDSGIEAIAFTDTEGLKHYLDRESPDMLLCNFKFAPEIASVSSSCHIFIIVTDTEATADYTYPTVFKYMSAEKILEKLNVKPRTILRKAEEVKERHLTAVFSVSDCIKTSAEALKLARMQAEERDTLFVSLNPFFALKGPDEDKINAVSELIFWVKSRNDGPKVFNELIQRYEGLSTITGCACWTDVSELKEAEAERLVTILKTVDGGNNTIIDMGFLSAASIVIMQSCDELYIVDAGGDAEKRAKEELMRQLDFVGCSDISAKVRYIAGEDGRGR